MCAYLKGVDPWMLCIKSELRRNIHVDSQECSPTTPLTKVHYNMLPEKHFVKYTD